MISADDIDDENMAHVRELSGDGAEMWDPLSQPDYALLAVASLHQVMVLVAVFHLWWCRHWPPYAVKSVSLVCTMGIAGALNLVGTILSFGFVKYDEPSLLSNCFVQGLVTWTGAGFFYSSTVVRVYRNHRVLVRHDADMMSPMRQILLLMVPIWGFSLALLSPSVAYMDFEQNRCKGEARFVLLAAFNYAAALLFGAVFLLWKMRNVRKQINEYKVMAMSLGFLFLTVLVLDATAWDVASDTTRARRVALMYNILRSALLFWPVIFTTLVKYVCRDRHYAEQFDVGKSPSLTPSLLRSSLVDQLKVEELWILFRKVAHERVAPELLGFYKAVMDRDREEEYFERQAKTMDIIDTFIVAGASFRVDISSGCRERILASEVTRHDIFREASEEVLMVMKDACHDAFQATASYGLLLRKAEKEEAELQALRKAKMVSEASEGESHAGRRFIWFGSMNASRSERWNNSTMSGRSGPVAEAAWTRRLCCSLRTFRWSAAGTASGEPRESGRRVSDSSSRTAMSSVSGACSGILGTRSDVANQHTRGQLSPSDCAAWGPSSPLPWLAEDVKDIEMGDVLAEGEGNTRTPSVFKDSRPFGGPTAIRTPPSPPPPPPPPPPLGQPARSLPIPGAPMSSLESSPASLALRDRAAPLAGQSRPPPAPWAPWRRTPEPAIAPSSSSPPAARAVYEAGERAFPRVGDEGRACAGGGAGVGMCGGGDEGESGGGGNTGEIGSSSSQESVVLLMPPSPATPLSTGSSRHGSDGRLRRHRRSSSPEEHLSAPGEARHTSTATFARSGPSSEARFEASASPRRSQQVAFLLADKDVGSVQLEEGFQSCGDFAAATGFVPARGFKPSMRLVEVAIAKEREEQRAAELASSSTEFGLSTTGLLAISVEPEEDSTGDEGETGQIREKPKATGDVRKRADAAGLTSPFSSAGGTERMESGVTSYSSMGGSERGDGVESRATAGVGGTAPRSQTEAVAEVVKTATPPPMPSAGDDALTDDTPEPSAASQPELAQVPAAPVEILRRSSKIPLPPAEPTARAPGPPVVAPQPPVSSDAMASVRDADATPLPPKYGALKSPPETAATVAAVASVARKGDDERKIELASSAAPPPGPPNPPSAVKPSFPSQAAPSAAEQPERAATERRAEGKGVPPQSPPLPKTSPPRPKTPPTSAAGRAERRAPPRAESRDRATLAMAAQAQAQAAWASQPATGLQTLKGSGPARAQPARAPPWSEALAALGPSTPPSAKDPQAQAECSPQRTPPPLPPPLLPLTLVAVGPPSHVTYAPPSPSGWSASGSPSSLRSSPVPSRPPVASMPPANRSGREQAPSGPGVPLVWSWSDSTLSGCSRSGGVGGGMSSVSASVCSDYTSPLVGMRFVEGEAGEESIKTGTRSRSNSGSGVLGVSKLPLMGVRASPPLLAVGRAGEEEAASLPLAADTGAGSSVDSSLAGRQPKVARRFFFP